MREDLLHYIWMYKKFPKLGLTTSNGESVSIVHLGSHNKLSGPDFFNAQVRIDDQLWAGNVEIHVNSSDWFAHNHQEDRNYDNVILHAVWNDDVSVYRPDGTIIPTLELKNYVDSNLLDNYRSLMLTRDVRFINCSKDIAAVSNLKFNNWLERLFIERLEDKSKIILNLLKEFKNDWEKVLFVLLLKNFGSKINGEAFLHIGKNFDFSIVRHLIHKPMELESLLFGRGGLLKFDTITDSYYLELKKSFEYLSHKYNLDNTITSDISFFRLRPNNFPTIRLSQFAALYSGTNNLFNSVMHCSDDELYNLFKIRASTYWDSHYTFGKVSKVSSKLLSSKFVDLLIINTIIPLRFCHQKHKGNSLNESFFTIMYRIKEENNNIIDNYKNIGVSVNSARDSQSLLQLYNNYCTKNKCLQCAVGADLLNLKS